MQDFICFSDAMDSKNDKQFKYLSSRIRALERKCEKEEAAPCHFNDEVSPHRSQ